MVGERSSYHSDLNNFILYNLNIEMYMPMSLLSYLDKQIKEIKSSFI